jgi:hypothetical protein
MGAAQMGEYRASGPVGQTIRKVEGLARVSPPAPGPDYAHMRTSPDGVTGGMPRPDVPIFEPRARRVYL